uniref:Uncharacterized protein n=1 Tax=Schizaphis graminum TaxID=13262 RepID=A0A2S2N9I7_SCHGA
MTDRSDDEKSSILDTVEADKKSIKKSTSQKWKDIKKMKTPIKKYKKNVSYREKIYQVFKDKRIRNDITNSISVRRSSGRITTTQFDADEKSTDYWTLTHYKTKNIKHIESNDRWKHTKCSVKLAITDRLMDQKISKLLNEVVV